jgi:hypothetical protein
MTEQDDTHRCFICNEPFKAGELVLQDETEGLCHRECFVNLHTGEPIGPDEPIPAGFPYKPEDWA